MGNFSDAIKKILSLGTIDPDNKKNKQETSRVTNQILLNELVEHFNQQMEELSVGRRLLYPMSFNVLMHPDDYNTTKESLPFILPEVVSAFYAAIKKKKDSYTCTVNFAPPATYWFFQFSACQVAELNGQEDFIKRGKIITTGNLTTFDIKNIHGGNVRSEVNVHLSVKCQNSNTNDNNINMDALLGMDILSEGSYTFNFDKNMNEDTTFISGTTNAQQAGWAKIRWAAADGGYLVYEMLDTYIDISGNSDSRRTRNICHIDSSAIITSHVQIRFDQTTRSFFLAAFAKTRLNGREVPLSNGGNPNWITLPKTNSKIFLNDAISVEFNANSNIL